jgi:putative FmdB family regulatory protein
MPTYEYECQKCSHQFEKFQSIMAQSLENCPKCRRKALKRLISSGGGVIFKGSGFYQTDYRSESYKKSAEKEKPSGSSQNKPFDSAQGKPSDKASPERDSATQGKPKKASGESKKSS